MDKTVLCFLIFFSLQGLQAQEKVPIDSLTSIYNANQDNIDALQGIIDYYERANLDSLNYYADILYRLSVKRNDIDLGNRSMLARANAYIIFLN